MEKGQAALIHPVRSAESVGAGLKPAPTLIFKPATTLLLITIMQWM